MIGAQSQEPEPAACLLDQFLREPGGISVRSRHPSISPFCSQNPSLATVEDGHIDGMATSRPSGR